MAKVHAYDILDSINKESDIESRKALIRKHGSDSPFNMLWSLNFCDRIKLDIPEGLPPYKQEGDIDEDAFPSNLASEIRKIGNCLVGVKMPKYKKENIFIQVCESIPLKEAELLVFAKDKVLEELYPNITKELVGEIFPSYVK